MLKFLTGFGFGAGFVIGVICYTSDDYVAVANDGVVSCMIERNKVPSSYPIRYNPFLGNDYVNIPKGEKDLCHE